MISSSYIYKLLVEVTISIKLAIAIQVLLKLSLRHLAYIISYAGAYIISNS